jgi:hypothetical protein
LSRISSLQLEAKILLFDSSVSWLLLVTFEPCAYLAALAGNLVDIPVGGRYKAHSLAQTVLWFYCSPVPRVESSLQAGVFECRLSETSTCTEPNPLFA